MDHVRIGEGSKGVLIVAQFCMLKCYRILHMYWPWEMVMERVVLDTTKSKGPFGCRDSPEFVPKITPQITPTIFPLHLSGNTEYSFIVNLVYSTSIVSIYCVYGACLWSSGYNHCQSNPTSHNASCTNSGHCCDTSSYRRHANTIP
jgi:hypothetical protein